MGQQPDVRVNPVDLDAAGAALARVGRDVVAAAREPGSPLTPHPAWAPGFDSVAAGATLAEAALVAVRRLGADVGTCAAAMRHCAAAWTASDDAVARSLRARTTRTG